MRFFLNNNTIYRSIEIENEKLRLKVHALTRKYEIFEAEHSQTKEYLEGQIRILEDKNNALNKSYASLVCFIFV